MMGNYFHDINEVDCELFVCEVLAHEDTRDENAYGELWTMSGFCEIGSDWV